MKKTWFSLVLVLMVFCSCFYASSFQYVTMGPVVIEALPETDPAVTPPPANSGVGVEHVWDNMNIDNKGHFTPGVANDKTKTTNMGTFLEKYKNFVLLFTGILTITSMGLMIFSIAKFAMAGSNEQARRNAIMGIMGTGIALALFGGATIVIAIFWNALSA